MSGSESLIREYSNLDVLHITFFYSRQTSISKIIDNLIRNITDIRQAVLSVSEFSGDLGHLVNITRPRILHLHYNGQHPQSAFLSELEYKPGIVHTMHSNVRSIFSDIATKIICVDETGLRNNDEGKSLVIENSVDVTGLAMHRPNKNGICNALRFSPDQMQTSVFDLFADIDTTVYFYGADDLLSFAPQHNAAMLEYAKRYPHIVCIPYTLNFEERVVEHSFFAYYLFNNNTHRTYGLSVMEPASLGMPIVAVRKAQPGQTFIRHGFNGFIADTDQDFIYYCKQLTSNDDIYQEMCENGRMHAATISNIMPGRYREVYVDLL